MGEVSDDDLEGASPGAVMERVRTLVAEVRDACAWYLDVDHSPLAPADAIRVLRSIERHADRETYVKARKLREWLSRTSSARSAG